MILTATNAYVKDSVLASSDKPSYAGRLWRMKYPGGGAPTSRPAISRRSSTGLSVRLVRTLIEATVLTAGPYDDTNPVWAPDGRRIAFMSGSAAESRLESIAIAVSRTPAAAMVPRI